MFAPVGRRDYDEARIRGSESLLHVLARAGVAVQWRDNQSRLQGRVRRAADATRVAAPTRPACATATRAWTKACCTASTSACDGREGTQRAWCCTCWATTARRTSGATRRPSQRFQPDCRERRPAPLHARADRQRLRQRRALHRPCAGHADRASCRRSAAEVDAALLYVSDHGESLGETRPVPARRAVRHRAERADPACRW